MSWPAAVLWVMMIAASFSRGPALIYLLFFCSAFGTLQMLPGSGTVNLLPQSACAVFLICKVMAQRGNITRGLEAALDPARLALFTAFLVYSVAASFLLPRIFSGLFEVVPVSAPRLGTDILRVTSGNISQTSYMIISYATALCFTVIGQTEAMRRKYYVAVLCSAYALIASGFIDLITYNLHIESVLEPFRTASYSMLTDVELGDGKRVVGFMSEASSFGSACVGMLSVLIFMRSLFRPGIEKLAAIGAIVLLACMSILSTSSTAYVGLAVLGGLFGLDMMVRLLDPSNPRRKQLNIELILAFSVLFGLFAIFVINSSVFNPIYNAIDTIVLQKTSSSSFEERSLWTRVGWEAFLDSGGLGAGLGSIRVSNWAVSILGSTGAFGALLLFGFLLQQLVSVPRGATREVKVFTTVTKLGILPTLVMYQLSATMPDLGPTAAITLGMIAATHATRNGRMSAPVERRVEAVSPLAVASAGVPGE